MKDPEFVLQEDSRAAERGRPPAATQWHVMKPETVYRRGDLSISNLRATWLRVSHPAQVSKRFV